MRSNECREKDLSRPQRVALLGSTGSIGRSSLEVLRAHRERFEVVCLSCHQSLELFQQQCQEFQPDCAIVTGERTSSVQGWLLGAGSGVEGVLERRGHGMGALIDALGSLELDIVIGAIVGVAGLHALEK